MSLGDFTFALYKGRKIIIVAKQNTSKPPHNDKLRFHKHNDVNFSHSLSHPKRHLSCYMSKITKEYVSTVLCGTYPLCDMRI